MPSKPKPNAPNNAPPDGDFGTDKAIAQGLNCIDSLCRAGGTRVVLAVSGGADSMAMAYLFHQWWFHCWRKHHPESPPCSECHLHFEAVIIDHGLRNESAAEASTTQSRLESLGIKATILTVSQPPPKSGVQAWARHHRYQALASFAITKNAIIVTAHHSDDQAETVLMRLTHGSGLEGLGGMAVWGHYAGVKVARPFLPMRGEDLRACLKDSGIAWAEDPSNCDKRFERVRCRAELAQNGLTPALLRLSASADRLHQHLWHTALSSVKMAVSPLGFGWIEYRGFLALPDLAQEMVLAAMVRAMAASRVPARKASLVCLRDALCSGRKATLGGCEWQVDSKHGRIICYAEAERLPQPLRITPSGAKGGAKTAYLFDGRWWVFLPPNIDACRIEAIGAERFACLRRHNSSPQWLKDTPAPARAFWRLPVLVGYSGVDREKKRLFASRTLDETPFIPHIMDNAIESPLSALPAMVFTGACAGYFSIDKAMKYECDGQKPDYLGRHWRGRHGVVQHPPAE